MKQVRIVRVDSLNGDTHFVIVESQPSDSTRIVEDLDENEIRKTSKIEASKPLILVRSE